MARSSFRGLSQAEMLKRASDIMLRRAALDDMRERRADLIERLAHMSPRDLVCSPLDAPQTRRVVASMGDDRFMVLVRCGRVYVGFDQWPDWKAAPRGVSIT